ncbi:MAG: hypothetical protein OXE04_04155 [bacterium]|nr:hypothetical protein [bacterium]
MGITRFVACLLVVLALCAVGCGSAESASVRTAPPVETATVVSMFQPSLAAGASNTAHKPVATQVPATPNVTTTPDVPIAAATPDVLPATPVTQLTPEIPVTPDIATLKRSASNSPFFQFGDGALGWDDQGQPVVLKVPAQHKALTHLREQMGHQHGEIVDTANTRLWLQKCLDYHIKPAANSPDTVRGQVAAQGFHDCLGGLSHLADLLASYWWNEAGLACVSSTVMNNTMFYDDSFSPLATCASVGYDPTAPRPTGWLQAQCKKLVSNTPNVAYPANASESGTDSYPLPSCWKPILEIVQAHAHENTVLGLPDSPHACFHAFLSYVWARQSGLDNRSPDNPHIGCQYRAFEATP